MVRPEPGVDVDPLKKTLSPMPGKAGENVKVGVGRFGLAAPVVTVCAVLPLRPASSVTVRDTL